MSRVGYNTKGRSLKSSPRNHLRDDPKNPIPTKIGRRGARFRVSGSHRDDRRVRISLTTLLFAVRRFSIGDSPPCIVVEISAWRMRAGRGLRGLQPAHQVGSDRAFSNVRAPFSDCVPAAYHSFGRSTS